MPLPFIDESRDLLDVPLLMFDDERALERPMIRFIREVVEIFLLFPLALLALWANLPLDLPKSVDETAGEFLCSVDGSGGELRLLLLLASPLLRLINGSPEYLNGIRPG